MPSVVLHQTRWILAVLAGILVVSTVVALPAGAQDDTTGAIFGELTYEDETGADVPVEGTTITVEGITFTEVTTDADGAFLVDGLESGAYLVSIDPSNLPEGVTLRNPDAVTRDLNVDAGRTSRALFALTTSELDAAAADEGSDFGRRFAQLTVEGLKLGLYLAMAAIGLSLIYGTTGLSNFSHAEMVTWGMLSTYFFNWYGLAGALGFMSGWPAPLGGGVNLIVAAFFGVIAGGCLGYVIDRYILRSARRAGVSVISQMVMTIGLSIGIRYIFLYNFGGTPRTFKDYSAQTAWEIGPVDITPKDLTAMLISIVVLVSVGLLLQRTRIGKAMRAVADNRDLAESSGIDVQKVITTVWVTGGALAALGGVFFGLDQVKWDFGWRILLLIFAAVTLGGLGTAYGALVGALVVGLTINLSTLWIDAELKNMVALLLLVVILIFRPQGILGQKERVG
jgi:neutral amino acid transport system permease protein